MTGFGAFPGAPRNPTEELLRCLDAQRDRLSQLGIDLSLRLLPVVYDAVGPAVDAAIATCKPDAILHLGLATRRRHVSVETRAVNCAGLLNPDADGRRPRTAVLVEGGAQVLAATCPATEIEAALRGTGLDARLSTDAGDYVCNATLYLSLHAAKAPSVGFIHVPQASRPGHASAHAETPSLDELLDGILAAIFVMGRRPPQERRQAV